MNQNKLNELEQELANVNSYVERYEKNGKKKKLKYWKNIQKYVAKKYSRELIIQVSTNS
jgi:hypothetical protein